MVTGDKARLRRDRGWCNGVGQGRTVLDRIRSTGNWFSKEPYIFLKWTASWQNQQNDCVPSEDSDQPENPPSLIRVFAIHMKKVWVLSYLPLSAQRRLRSDWADAQADLSLRWAHIHFVGFVMRRVTYFYSTPCFTVLLFLARTWEQCNYSSFGGF